MGAERRGRAASGTRPLAIVAEYELVEEVGQVIQYHAIIGALEPCLLVGEDPVAACASISTAK